MLKKARKSAYFALILREEQGAMLELRSALKIKELRICGDIPGSLSFRGVMKFSKWKSGGDITERNTGSKNKKEFIAANEGAEFDGETALYCAA